MFPVRQGLCCRRLGVSLTSRGLFRQIFTGGTLDFKGKKRSAVLYQCSTKNKSGQLIGENQSELPDIGEKAQNNFDIHRRRK